MSGTALILAAHGSRHDPAVNAAILGYAATIAEGARFDEVGVGFHQGTPHFSECIDRLTGDQVVVVPVMTSAGWYRRIALPRELARNHRLPLCHVVITEPVGTHPEMVERFARRAGCIVRECEFVPAEVSLAIVGHGTRRFSDSRCATESLAGALRSRAGFAEVLVAFLDDDPAVDTLMDRARQGNLIVIPFLVANGPHAARDIPAALGLVSPPGTALPVSGRVNGRRVYVDSAIGTDPGWIDIIVARAEEALGRGHDVGDRARFEIVAEPKPEAGGFSARWPHLPEPQVTIRLKKSGPNVSTFQSDRRPSSWT